MSGSVARLGGVAIVTGASSGIGQALSLELARRGHRVLAIARRAELLDALSKDAKAEGGADIIPFAADLASPDTAARVAARAEGLGGATWLVNNAGTTAYGPACAQDPELLIRIVRLNCEALLRLTATVVPSMTARKNGIVLNVGSVAGFMATPYMAAYGASKAFVISLSEGLREELLHTGVSVTVVCPGPVSTGIYEVGAPGIARTPPSHEMTAAACARFAIDAAERRRAIAIPGAQNRLNVWAAKLLPRALLRAFLRRSGLSYLGYPRDALTG